MEKFSQFGVEPILLLAQIVNFLILLYLLKRFLYKPILELLKKREEKIREGLKAGEKGEEFLLKAREEEKQILSKASEEAHSVLEETRARASQLEAELLSHAKEESERLVTQARAQIEVEKKVVERELEKNVVATAVRLLGTILPKVLSKEDHTRILVSSEKTLRKALPS